MTDVAPPAGLPWDLDQITADALAVLRYGPGDVDAGRINDAASSATALLEANLDLPEPYETSADIPAPVHAAAVQVTIEQYRRKDASFGVVGAWSDNTEPFRVSSDPLAGVRRMALPWKRRWGLA